MAAPEAAAPHLAGLTHGERRPFVVYWNNIPSPYMVERFNALADRGRCGFDAWFNDRIESDRSWDVDEADWRFRHRYLPTTRILGRTQHWPLPLLGRRPDVLVSLYAEPVFLAGRGLATLDVEGFEANVIRGAAGLLAQDSLQAVLVELNRLDARYGFSDADIHAQLLKHGFRPARYGPVARQLHALEDHRTEGNTLYVRASTGLDQRLRQAQPFVWGEIAI